MSAPFLAEIRAVGFTFAPKGWALCNGQLLPISQNTALFSLLGTMYGGDGKVTFALPNLQASFALHAGPNSGGLTQYFVGEADGQSTVTLLQTELPPHNHVVQGSNEAGTANSANNATWAEPHFGRSVDKAYATTGATALMSPAALAVAGSSAPHNNLPPFVVVTYIIALQGIFPPRP